MLACAWPSRRWRLATGETAGAPPPALAGRPPPTGRLARKLPQWETRSPSTARGPQQDPPGRDAWHAGVLARARHLRAPCRHHHRAAAPSARLPPRRGTRSAHGARRSTGVGSSCAASVEAKPRAHYREGEGARCRRRCSRPRRRSGHRTGRRTLRESFAGECCGAGAHTPGGRGIGCRGTRAWLSARCPAGSELPRA